jgi:hypothetical protein
MIRPPDEQIAALQAETLEAGRRSGWLRVFVWAGTLAGVPLACGAVAAYRDLMGPYGPHGIQYEGPLRAPTIGFAAMMEAVLPAAVMAGLLGLLLVWAYRRSWRARLRNDLAGLPVEQRAAVLQPLQRAHCPETRRIVAPLVAELRSAASEVSPASAPAGRGDEASSADTQPFSAPHVP